MNKKASSFLPKKPVMFHMNTRIPAELHAQAVAAAEQLGVTMQDFCVAAFEKYLNDLVQEGAVK